MASDLGDGFFVKLGLKTDKDSFDKGLKAVDGISNSFDRLVSSVKNAAPVLAAAMAGTFETAELKTARSIGISTDALDSWKVAAGMAGTSAGALTSSMAALENKMQGLKIGQVDQNLAKNLGFLGIGYKQFADMDASQRMSSVFKAAQAMQDQGKAALLVQNILGSAGADYYHYLQLSGTTLEHELEIGRNLTFTSDESKRKAMEFNHELQGVYSAGKSIGTLFGSEVGAALTPTIKQFREWLGVNNEAISSGITGFVETLGEYFNKLVGFIEKGAPKLGEIVEQAGGLDKIIIRLGIGLGGLKILQLVSGLSGLLGTIGPLGMALGGIVLTGTLLDPDLIKSIATPVKDGFDKMKKPAKELADALGSLIKEATDSDSVEEGLQKITTSVSNFAANLVTLGTESISGFTYHLAALKAYISGDYNLANEYMAKGDAAYGAAFEAVVGTEAKEKVDNYFKSDLEWRTAEKNMKDAWGTPYFETVLKSYNEKYPDHKYKIVTDKKGNQKLESVKDGIIGPGGRVTKVDPQDWVFAAKDVGALASAFIPRGFNANSFNAPSQYIINQTFNVSGSKDLPQTLRQQAYRGTQEGLANIMQRNAQRLQLMSGTV